MIRSITINFDGDIFYQKVAWNALSSTESISGVPKEQILISFVFNELLKQALKKYKKGKKLNMCKVNLIKNKKMVLMED